MVVAQSHSFRAVVGITIPVELSDRPIKDGTK